MIGVETQNKTQDDVYGITEEELWRACASGDDAAREKLILSYRPMVYWLAKKLHVPYGTYPDLIQEGMVALIGAVDAYDINRANRFSTYAYYKIKGRLINYLERVEAKAPIPVEDEVFLEGKDALSFCASEACDLDWTIDIEQAFTKLSEREASVLKALVVEGRSAKDIAAGVSLDVSHIYRIRKKALNKLKQWLSAEESETTFSV